MRRSVLLLPLVAVLSVAGCAGGASTAAPASVAAPSTAASAPAGSAAGGGACATAPAGSTATVTVTIKGFAYSPQPVQAKVGDIVAWSNQDTAPHSATMDTAGCDTDTINVGATGMLVFNQAGTYTYHCAIHPTQMKDFTVEVK